MNILVVEKDVGTIRQMFDALNNILGRQEMISVRFVQNGMDAEERLRGKQFDLVSVSGSFHLAYGQDCSERAGLSFLKSLEACGHTGRTIFYSDSDDQATEASLVRIKSNSVLGSTKRTMPIAAWARNCVERAQKPPCSL